jgi:hypothetical protein
MPARLCTLGRRCKNHFRKFQNTFTKIFPELSFSDPKFGFFVCHMSYFFVPKFVHFRTCDKLQSKLTFTQKLFFCLFMYLGRSCKNQKFENTFTKFFPELSFLKPKFGFSYVTCRTFSYLNSYFLVVSIKSQSNCQSHHLKFPIVIYGTSSGNDSAI